MRGEHDEDRYEHESQANLGQSMDVASEQDAHDEKSDPGKHGVGVVNKCANEQIAWRIGRG